ncbi:MAG: M24 family metallopeptidase C-terminal domain-containing protein [Anaerovoracaceae bacterium]
MLTLCPYEREAIDTATPTDEELNYIDDYHSWVCETLSPIVSEKTDEWLKEQCRPLK